jgi:hypothetical protein
VKTLKAVINMDLEVNHITMIEELLRRDYVAGEETQRKSRGDTVDRSVYRFPRAAITYYHILDGLKQQKFILSQFWKLEV